MRHEITPPLCVDCLEDDPAKFLLRSDSSGRLIRNRCAMCHSLWDIERKAESAAKRIEVAARNRGCCRGEENGQSKLTESEVLLIFSDTRTRSEIAKAFNIRPMTVYDIKSGRRWGWLTCEPAYINRVVLL